MKKIKKNLARSLHRDLGYFFIGITLIYAITGFVLSVRGLGWFKEEYVFKTLLTQNIQIENFKEKLISEAKAGKLDEIYASETAKTVERNINRMGFIEKTDDKLLFKYKERLIIKYDQMSGQTDVYYKAYPKYLQLFISAHLSTNNYVWYYLAMIYSVVLAFFAISAIFIVKGKYGFKKRGLVLCLAGIVVVLVFIYFSFYSS